MKGWNSTVVNVLRTWFLRFQRKRKHIKLKSLTFREKWIDKQIDLYFADENLCSSWSDSSAHTDLIRTDAAWLCGCTEGQRFKFDRFSVNWNLKNYVRSTFTTVEIHPFQGKLLKLDVLMKFVRGSWTGLLGFNICQPWNWVLKIPSTLQGIMIGFHFSTLFVVHFSTLFVVLNDVWIWSQIATKQSILLQQNMNAFGKKWHLHIKCTSFAVNSPIKVLPPMGEGSLVMMT